MENGLWLLLALVSGIKRSIAVDINGLPIAIHITTARATIGADVIIAKQSDLKHGVITAQRWIVERSFSWLGKWRQL
jgi:hypothetical protein